jgi:alkylhydroperoxidase family enzyme
MEMTRTPYLPPVERPHGLLMKIAYAFSRRVFGKVPTPLAVVSARLPFAFLRFQTRIDRLNRKLTVPRRLQLLVGQQVSQLNGCGFCIDLQRWFVARKTSEMLGLFEALPRYTTSPLFSDAERAALDYATELTLRKHVAPDTFSALARHYNERQICEIVWLVASEHIYNLTNHGLNIGSDGLCRIPAAAPAATADATGTPEPALR